MTGERAEQTIDAFHNGRFRLVQPARGGHRAGMDALLLASVVPADFSGAIADFGAGAGAVGFAVLSRCPDARAALIERSPDMVDCARQSLALDGNQWIARRALLIEGDVTDGKARAAAGLADRAADFILMNPPFNDGRDRATPEDLRRQAHVADENLLENWIRSAAAVAGPRAGLAVIARPASIAAMLAAMKGRFGGVEIVPIQAFATRPAIRIIVRARLGSRAALSILPPFILHQGEDKTFTAHAQAINGGVASLFDAFG